MLYEACDWGLYMCVRHKDTDHWSELKKWGLGTLIKVIEMFVSYTVCRVCSPWTSNPSHWDVCLEAVKVTQVVFGFYRVGHVITRFKDVHIKDNCSYQQFFSPKFDKKIISTSWKLVVSNYWLLVQLSSHFLSRKVCKYASTNSV